MKIVFIGTVNFSKKMLEKLIYMGVDIVGVCTKQKSDFNADYVELAPICIENNIPYQYVEDINSDESLRWIERQNPEVIFCFGWSSLIKEPLLMLPAMGVVGYHPAKLPKNRGRHPIIWAIALGLKSSASTFFFMEQGTDDGDILSQVDFDILDTDDAQSLYDKITNIAIEQLIRFVPQLENNTFSRIKQNHLKANIWRKRTKGDGRIDFRMTSSAIYNLIRALTKPYPGAHIEYQGKDIIVWKAEKSDYVGKNIEPGKILEVSDNTILVKTDDNAIRLMTHEFDILPVAGEYL